MPTAISSLHNTASKTLADAGSNHDDLWWPLHCQCFAPRTLAAVPQLLDEQRLALSYAVWHGSSSCTSLYSNVRSFGIDLQSNAELLPIAAIIRTLNNTRSVSCRGSCIRTAKHDEVIKMDEENKKTKINDLQNLSLLLCQLYSVNFATN